MSCGSPRAPSRVLRLRADRRRPSRFRRRTSPSQLAFGNESGGGKAWHAAQKSTTRSREAMAGCGPGDVAGLAPPQPAAARATIAPSIVNVRSRRFMVARLYLSTIVRATADCKRSWRARWSRRGRHHRHPRRCLMMPPPTGRRSLINLHSSDTRGTRLSSRPSAFSLLGMFQSVGWFPRHVFYGNRRALSFAMRL